MPDLKHPKSFASHFSNVPRSEKYLIMQFLFPLIILVTASKQRVKLLFGLKEWTIDKMNWPFFETCRLRDTKVAVNSFGAAQKCPECGSVHQLFFLFCNSLFRPCILKNPPFTQKGIERAMFQA